MQLNQPSISIKNKKGDPLNFENLLNDLKTVPECSIVSIMKNPSNGFPKENNEIVLAVETGFLTTKEFDNAIFKNSKQEFWGPAQLSDIRMYGIQRLFSANVFQLIPSISLN